MARSFGSTGRLQASMLVALAAVSVVPNTDLDAPPRFDGAGYAVLAESLRTGRGYRAVDHPDAPRHAHFPPGYPLTLAALWGLVGRSARAAHALSAACTVAATLAAWLWLRRRYPPGVAFGLGAALAVNWSWGRLGGSIQSEPPYLLLEMLALLAADAAARRPPAFARSATLGLLLGAATLTRHVGVTLAVAVAADLGLRRRAATAAVALTTMAVVVAPWAAWMATVGRETQVELLPRRGLTALIASQALFYARRLPDQVTGPVVEVGTVFRPGLAGPATGWAFVATAAIAWGWLSCLRSTRRRLVGLVPLATLPLLLAWPFTEAGRFLVPLVPFVLVGAFEGTADLLRRLGTPRRVARAWAVGLVLAASLPYAAYAIASRRAAASQATHADFDAACAWIARRADRPGPVLTRQPGEVWWQAGRHALPPPDDPAEIDRIIGRYRVAYLVVDDDRIAGTPAGPLGRYVATRPDRMEPAWRRGNVVIYAVVGGSPRSSNRSATGSRRPGRSSPPSSASASEAIRTRVASA